MDRLRRWLGSETVWVAGRVENRLHVSEGEDAGQALLAYATGAPRATALRRRRASSRSPGRPPWR